MGKIDDFFVASFFAAGAYLTIHGFTKDSTLPTQLTGIIVMMSAPAFRNMVTSRELIHDLELDLLDQMD